VKIQKRKSKTKNPKIQKSKLETNWFVGILTLLDHPNIVKLVGGNGPNKVTQLQPGNDFFTQDPFIITEWVPTTLDKIGILPWSDYLSILGIKYAVITIFF
jgi:hypothetical protein